MDYCRSCGAEVANGTRQCPDCGDLIDEFADNPIGDPSASEPVEAATERSSSSESSMTDEVLSLAQRQGKIAAIKHYREATGCGLKESKEAVESLLTRHGIEARQQSGCAGATVLAALLALGLSVVLMIVTR